MAYGQAFKRADRGMDQTHAASSRHFYIGDGLITLPTEAEAIDLVKLTRASLAESHLKLHKIASNSVVVMLAFPCENLAAGLRY